MGKEGKGETGEGEEGTGGKEEGTREGIGGGEGREDGEERRWEWLPPLGGLVTLL